MNWSFPTEGPKTLNGLILETLEMIPEPGTCLKIDEYPIEIVRIENNRVQVARISARRKPQVSLEEN